MSKEPGSAQAAIFLAKAAQMMRWCSIVEGEMKAFAELGQMDGVERCFSCLLSWIASIHEALDASAGKLREFEWRTALNQVRNADQLLRYMWKCRDLHVHDSLFTWEAGAFSLTIAVPDSEEIQQFKLTNGTVDIVALMSFLYECGNAHESFAKMTQGFRPTKERQDAAGVQLSDFSQGLHLKEIAVRINGKMHAIPPPMDHLGSLVGPFAFQATTTTLKFYQTKYEELMAACERAQGSVPQVPAA